MKKILVTGGHHYNAPGAVHGDRAEFPETRIWADAVLRYLHELGMPCTVVSNAPLAQKLPTINNAIYKAEKEGLECLLIEVHFNSSASGKARGFETLHYPESVEGMKLADVCQTAMASVMSGKDRGSKEGWHRMDKSRGVNYLLKRSACPAVIIEPQFVQAFDEIEERREECCKAIAQALYEVYGG
ncbi:MAG: N-acetylmuramoyl-L-alanine amidase [Shewanella sp.]|nr:N-acetylmuramoyl-L-alanine amidase [Shewanella sp.]